MEFKTYCYWFMFFGVLNILMGFEIESPIRIIIGTLMAYFPMYFLIRINMDSASKQEANNG